MFAPLIIPKTATATGREARRVSRLRGGKVEPGRMKCRGLKRKKGDLARGAGGGGGGGGGCLLFFLQCRRRLFFECWLCAETRRKLSVCSEHDFFKYLTSLLPAPRAAPRSPARQTPGRFVYVSRPFPWLPFASTHARDDTRTRTGRRSAPPVGFPLTRPIPMYPKLISETISSQRTFPGLFR